MKKIIILIVAIAFSALLQAQQFFTADQQEVQQAVVQLFDALSNRDSVSLKAHSTADITLFEYGQVWNIDTLILKAITLNTSADFKRTNRFEFINTRVDKTTAWLTYHLQSAITKDGKQVVVQWLETVFLIKAKKTLKKLYSKCRCSPSKPPA